MEQHPIPQQISSYEFKLVGEMTLKQFLKAAAGIVLALIINSSHIIFFIKWPLMLLCGGGGLLLAFVPFQDRPLEDWIFAFIKSIYSPTIYTYKKVVDNNWTNLGEINDKKEEEEEEETEEEEVKDRNRVKEFIESLPEIKAEEVSRKKVEEEPEDRIEEERVAEILRENEGIKDAAKESEKQDEDWRDKKVELDLKTEKLGATAKVVFGTIPMPDKPDTPNLVVGMATDIEGKIVEGAIVEIQDEKGNPSRVLKTNSLGQFRTTTPLANGKYLVITEKENYNFDRVNIELAGKIVDPIKIQAIA